MATEEDLKKADDASADEAEELEAKARSSAPPPADAAEAAEGDAPDAEAKADASDADADVREAEADAEQAAPMQLGYVRYVYAAYMAVAMFIAFIVAKLGHIGWYRLGQWKPGFGEPQDEVVYPIAGLIGILVAYYYWKKPSTRQYTNEVAEELSKVTWPDRKEVTNSTFVPILTTEFATLFFALMDQFWQYVTDKIYSF
jgi:preprotein translocase subunit SecE